MKRDYPDRPIVGVGAIIIQDHRALVVRRANEEPLDEIFILQSRATQAASAAREAPGKGVIQVGPITTPLFVGSKAK